MKLRKGKSTEGGVLVVTIVICALVGLMLSAYLSMVSSQHSFTQRSQVWNNVIPMCEAGIEEAMAPHREVEVGLDALAGADRVREAHPHLADVVGRAARAHRRTGSLAMPRRDGGLPCATCHCRQGMGDVQTAHAAPMPTSPCQAG